MTSWAKGTNKLGGNASSIQFIRRHYLSLLSGGKFEAHSKLMAKAAAAAASAVKMLLPLSSARKCWTEVTKRLAKLAKQDPVKARQNN